MLPSSCGRVSTAGTALIVRGRLLWRTACWQNTSSPVVVLTINRCRNSAEFSRRGLSAQARDGASHVTNPSIGSDAKFAERTADTDSVAADGLRAAHAERISVSSTPRLVPQLPVPTAGGGLPAVREFDLRQSFYKFPFRREVQLGLMKMGVSVPTRVQDLTIPKLLHGQSVFMLAQTGTGKTLAFVLPIVHSLLATNTEGFFPMSKRPRVIIVQPTRELAMQTVKVVRHFPVRSALLAPGSSFVKEGQALYAGIDVVVTTPYRLCLHLGKEHMFLNQVKHLVLDEADTICDTFYEEDTRRILRGLADECAQRPQVVVVGATRTGAVSSFLDRNLSNVPMLPVVTTDAHQPPPQVEQVFQPTRGKRRIAVLQEVLAEVPAVGRKTLIFTNRVPSCKSVTKALLEHGISAVALHGNMHPRKRKQVWTEFNGSGADVMVCTNLASRGLDFNNIHHVIMFDFPHNLADYLHRVGRTARGGRAGRVTTITPKRFWPFVTKIQEASKAGRPIEVKHATKNMKKILSLQAYEKAATSGRLANWQQRRVRKRLGLPPARHLGSRETKIAMKRIMRKVKAVKKMRFLQRRGILKKGHGLPAMPDFRVETTETQTVSTLVRARDGLLQVVPKRRRALAGAEAAPTQSVGRDGGPKDPMTRARRRPSPM